MKKKLILIVAVIVLLVAGGKFAYEKGRNYFAGKMIGQLAATGEVQRYKENLEKEIEQTLPDDKTEKQEEGKSDTTPSENNITDKKSDGAGDFWSEPLVKEVYGRFSASEISTCTSMLSGGLTGEEKRYIKQLVFSRVSSAEISEIEKLYYKYNK